MGKGSEVDLLFRIEGDATGAKKATAETRAAARSLVTSFGPQMAELTRVSSLATQSIGKEFSILASRIPGVGAAVSGLRTEFGSLISPSALLTVGLVAVAGAVGSVAVNMFQLIERSSKLGGELFDLVQQTGLGAERVTALKFATDQAGGSIEKFSNGLKILAITIVEANRGSEEAIAKLKRLGIEPKEGIFNLDAALNKALQTIAKAPSGIAQMSLAADAFGRKIGPDLIPTIVSFNGNLDELTDRARRLGVTLNDVQLQQLESFGDTLDTLRLQGTLLAARFSAQVAPEITAAMQRISQSAGKNQSAVEQWGKATADAMRGLRAVADSEVGQLLGLFGALTVKTNLLVLAFKGLEALGVTARATDPSEDFFGPGGAARGGRKALPGTPEFKAEEERAAKLREFERALEEERKKGGGGAKKPADTELQNALKDASLIERETRERLESDILENRRALEEQARDIEAFTRRAIELSDEQLNATIDRVNAEQAAIERALRKRKITQEEFNRRERELTLQTDEAVRKNSDEVFRLEQERDRRKSEAEIAANQRALQIEEEARQRIIERIERRIDKGVLLETEGARQIADIVDESFRRRIETLKEEDSAVATSVERRAIITDEIIRLEGERASATEQAANRIADAIETEIKAERRLADEIKEISDLVRDIQLDIAQEVIRSMVVNFASRRDIIRAQRDLELAEEVERHRRATESINRQKEEVDKEIGLLQKRIESLKIGTTEEIEEHNRLIRSLESLRQKRDELNQQQDQENIFSQTRKRRVTDEADKDLESTSPFDKLKIDIEDIKRFAKELEDSIVPIAQILRTAFFQVADAIGQTVSNWILLGETGPSVMRKILAQALASIAAEASANMVKELALGFATLFFNPAESAGHFVSAGLWATLAGGSALVGRKVAGGLFEPTGASAGAGGTGGGSGERGELSPLNLARNAGVGGQQQQAPQLQPDRRVVEHRVVFEVKVDENKFGRAINTHLTNEWRNGGRIRELVLTDGETTE